MATTDVRPDDPPIGVTFTSLGTNGQVLINGNVVAGTGAHNSGVTLVVLDGNTRAPLAVLTRGDYGTGAMTAVANLANQWIDKAPDSLMLITSQNGTDGGGLNALTPVLSKRSGRTCSRRPGCRRSATRPRSSWPRATRTRPTMASSARYQVQGTRVAPGAYCPTH